MPGPRPDDRSAVALAFANTPDEGFADAAEASAALQAWLTERGLIAAGVVVTRAELQRFLRLRDAVRSILAARVDRADPDGSAVRIVEAASLAAPGAPVGVWARDGTVSRTWRSTGGDPLDRAAATLAGDVVDLVCDRGGELARGPGGEARFVLAGGG